MRGGGWVGAAALVGILWAGSAAWAQESEGSSLREENFDRATMGMGRVRLGVSTPPERGSARGVSFEVLAPFLMAPLSEEAEDHDALWSVGFSILRFEDLDLSDELRTESSLGGLRVGVRHDARLWGAETGLELITVAFDELFVLSPTLGLRIGDPDVVMFTARLDMRGLFAVSTSETAEQRLRQNYDLQAAVALPLSKILHLQGRLRLRDVADPRSDSFGGAFRQRDAWLVAGFEAAIDVDVRLLPLFVGFGFREVFEHAYGVEAVEAPGQQFLVLVETTLGMVGTSGLW